MDLQKVNCLIDDIYVNLNTSLAYKNKEKLELLKNEVNKSNRLEKLVSKGVSQPVQTAGKFKNIYDIELGDECQYDIDPDKFYIHRLKTNFEKNSITADIATKHFTKGYRNIDARKLIVLDGCNNIMRKY